MKVHALLAALALLAPIAMPAQDIELQVELLGPLGTQTNSKGDTVTARVLSPDSLKGDIAEGKVTEAKSGGKLRGTAVLNFTFETLRHGGEAIPISSQIKSIANSKGKVNVDEEGRVIRKGGNVGKALGGTGLGGLIGGIAGGAKGAVIGAGVGAAASIILIQVAAEGPSVRFDAGSRLTLSCKSRSGPALGSLTRNAEAAETAPPAAQAAAAPADAPAAAAAAPADAPAAASSQLDFKVLKDDFIPGEKVLLYDDFTDMSPDEAPPHWKVRGAAITLSAAGELRQITADRKVMMTPMVEGLPRNFTLETDLQLSGYSKSGWYFLPKGSNNYVFQIWTEPRSDKTVRLYVRTNLEMLNDSEVAVEPYKPIKKVIWVQDGRVRVYLNGQKAVDVNQVKLPELAGAYLEADPSQNVKNSRITYSRVRIAESTPDFSRTIASAGRYVTHGIHFDTDSDRIKPESAAVIKSIARGMELNPNLKLKIEGHTDSTGSADHNQDLSKRRADAVKAVLVSQFNIDAARLTTEGLGSSKPMDSNDTPQGRVQNRRVEFVKQ